MCSAFSSHQRSHIKPGTATKLPHLSVTVKRGFALPGEGVTGGEGFWLSLSHSLLAEFLPHLGGLQLEGHQVALPAQVSGGQGGGGGTETFLLPTGTSRGAQHPLNSPLHSLHPRTTVLAAVAFLDAFQKVADMATNTRGRVLPTQGWVSPGWARQGDRW